MSQYFSYSLFSFLFFTFLPPIFFLFLCFHFFQKCSGRLKAARYMHTYNNKGFFLLHLQCVMGEKRGPVEEEMVKSTFPKFCHNEVHELIIMEVCVPTNNGSTRVNSLPIFFRDLFRKIKIKTGECEPFSSKELLYLENKPQQPQMLLHITPKKTTQDPLN